MSDQLTPISYSELSKIKDLLATDFPSHLVGYGIIATLQEWCLSTPKLEDIDIFSLNGTWSDDGLFIVIDRCDLHVYSMIADNDRLRRALRLVNWNQKWRIVSLDSRSYSDVLSVLSEMNVNWNFNEPFDTLYCPPENAINIKYKVPEDVVLRRLVPVETAVVDNLWMYRHPGSDVSIRRLIEKNYCVGAYDNATGELLGWCLTYISQCHNALQIKPKCMGRGLGRLIVAKLAHERALENKWSHAFVSAENKVSQKVFKSNGFVKVGEAYWILTDPRNE